MFEIIDSEYDGSSRECLNSYKLPTLQVLVATMGQTDHDLLDKMKITSSAIVGNQCDRDYVERFMNNGRSIIYLNFRERGVGLNRNNALMRANANICLFADDDMVYVNGYEQKVFNAFDRHKDADVIIFNLHEKVPTRYIIKKDCRIGRFNYLRYGTARIAVKLESIKKNAIYFNQCFGGGTEYPHGEDSLFLTACLDKKLKIYGVPEYIASLTEERESTWKGKISTISYIKGQGALYKAISHKWWKLLCLQDAVRRAKSYGINWLTAYSMMIEAVK